MIISSGLILLAISLVGGYLSYLYGRKVKRFRWSEYFLLMIVPVAGSLALSYQYGTKIIYLFFISMFVGFALEYLLGLGYHKTLNRRLWTYGRYSVGGYTSLLTFPMWGVAGVAFWLLSQSIGL